MGISRISIDSESRMQMYKSFMATIPSDNFLPLVRECADPRIPTVDKGIDASPLSWVVSYNSIIKLMNLCTYFLSSFRYFTLWAHAC